MHYEYLEDIAGELGVDADELQEVIQRLGIETQQTAIPPYGSDVTAAISRQDAAQLRRYFGEKAH